MMQRRAPQNNAINPAIFIVAQISKSISSFKGKTFKRPHTLQIYYSLCIVRLFNDKDSEREKENLCAPGREMQSACFINVDGHDYETNGISHPPEAGISGGTHRRTLARAGCYRTNCIARVYLPWVHYLFTLLNSVSNNIQMHKRR